MLDELSVIANEYCCEKYTKCDYTVHYDKFLNFMRNKKFNLLEIGVADGRSLRMWEKYFPLAEIYGIDVNPVCITQSTKHCHVYNINQCDRMKLTELCEYVGNFDVICDDGSHIASDVIDSLDILYPYLNDGGFYIVEDILPNCKEKIYNTLKKYNIVHTSCAKYYPESEVAIILKGGAWLN